MVELRLPNIKGATEKEQLMEIKGYLYQLAEQLQFALNSMNTSSSQVVTPVQVVSYPVSHVSNAGTSTQATFNSIKSLIIKSAEIVDAYYEEINRRLESVYVAQSDFGDFAQRTSQEIEETSTSITQGFENIQVIISGHDTDISSINESLDTMGQGLSDAQNNINSVSTEVEVIGGTLTDVNADIESVAKTVSGVNTEVEEIENALVGANAEIDGVKSGLAAAATEIESVEQALNDANKEVDAIKSAIIEVNANIRSGLLYIDDNSIPIYGLEIGQKNVVDGVEVFNKFARFTADRLSFYDQNGIEVAYISDYKLYITNVHITASLTVGGFKDTVLPDGSVVTKWIGG